MKFIETINTGIFPFNVLFCYNFSYEGIISTLKENGDTEWYTGIDDAEELLNNGSYFGLHRHIENIKTKESRHLFYIILTKPFKFKDEDYCTLAHEVLHICQFMLPIILNRDNEFEAEAYLHSHLMSQCLKLLRDATSKNTTKKN